LVEETGGPGQNHSLFVNAISVFRGRRDLIVVGFTTIYAISAFHPCIVSLNSAHCEDKT
jgi:hypothetical protein